MEIEMRWRWVGKSEREGGYREGMWGAAGGARYGD